MLKTNSHTQMPITHNFTIYTLIFINSENIYWHLGEIIIYKNVN